MKTLALALLCCLATPAFAAKPKDKLACTSFLILIEHDAQTMNLNMAGANDPQIKWYAKDGNQKEFAGVCLISPDSTGKRIVIRDDQDDPEHYMEKL